MALLMKTHSDQVLDVKGHALHNDAAHLLGAWDKILTLRSYYSPEHEQYLKASEDSAREICEAIYPRPSLALEIKAEGFVILDQCLDPRTRQVRQIHELLVPLNIARLEIRAGLSGADLRQALSTLDEHRRLVGQSQSFQEIVVTNLPETVQVISCSVSGSRNADGSGGVDSPENRNEKLAREFLDLVSGILGNLELTREALKNSNESGQAESWVRLDTEALRQGLQKLVEFNPSPKQLLELIANARSALDLSRDPQSADLVFKILRKDMLGEKTPIICSDPPAGRGIQFQGTVSELMLAVEGLEKNQEPLPGYDSGALENQLSLSLALLSGVLPDGFRRKLHQSLVQVLKENELKPEILEPWFGALETALESGKTEEVDMLLTMTLDILRQANPRLLGFWWNRLAEQDDSRFLAQLWPHLVNDILMGMGRLGKQFAFRIHDWAASLPEEEAWEELERLQELPAMRNGLLTPSLFQIPLVRTHRLCVVLATTPLAPWLGEGLFEAMKTRPVNQLAKSLMNCLECFEDDHLNLYLELMAPSPMESLGTESREIAARILFDCLRDLPRNRRKENWVAAAVACLFNLQVESHRPFLQEIVNQRWLFFGRAWPKVCREAGMKGEV